MTPEDAARAWIEGWSRAWPAKDAELVGSLYADDAVFNEQPFRVPRRGGSGARDYAWWAFQEQAEVRCWFGEPILGIDERVAVEWWAIITTHDEGDQTIAGTSILRFDPDGRVREQHDYWSQTEGAVEPRPGWGRSSTK